MNPLSLLDPETRALLEKYLGLGEDPPAAPPAPPVNPGVMSGANMLPTSARGWIEPNLKQAKDVYHGLLQLPELVAGTPVDLATMAMRPFGYDTEKPVGGSEWLIDKAREYGMLPPQGKEGEQLGSILASTIDPLSGAAKLAALAGKAPALAAILPVARLGKSKPLVGHAFESGLEQAIAESKQATASGNQWAGYLSTRAKKAEMEDRGVAQFLASKGDAPVAKEELIAAMNETPFQIFPRVAGGPDNRPKLEDYFPDLGEDRIRLLDNALEHPYVDTEGAYSTIYGDDMTGTNYAHYYDPDKGHELWYEPHLMDDEGSMLQHFPDDAVKIASTGLREGFSSTTAKRAIKEWRTRTLFKKALGDESVPEPALVGEDSPEYERYTLKSKLPGLEGENYRVIRYQLHPRVPEEVAGGKPAVLTAAEEDRHRELAMKAQMDGEAIDWAEVPNSDLTPEEGARLAELQDKADDFGLNRTERAEFGELHGRAPRLKQPYDGDIDNLDLSKLTREERLEIRDLNKKDTEVQAPVHHSPFTGGHWRGMPDVFAHSRLIDRNIGGERFLHMEELQSDWHQEAWKARKAEIQRLMKEESLPREEASKKVPADFGYRSLGVESERALAEEQLERVRFDYRHMSEAELKAQAEELYLNTNRPYNSEDALDWYDLVEDDPAYKAAQEKVNSLKNAGYDSVPDVPMKGNWHEMALKHTLKTAADEGYEGVLWTGGMDQIERWKDALRQRVDEVHHFRDASGDLKVVARKDGRDVFSGTIPYGQHVFDNASLSEAHGAALHDVVGSNIAEQILRDSPPPEASAVAKAGGDYQGVRVSFDGSFFYFYGKKAGGKEDYLGAMHEEADLTDALEATPDTMGEGTGVFGGTHSVNGILTPGLLKEFNSMRNSVMDGGLRGSWEGKLRVKPPKGELDPDALDFDTPAPVPKIISGDDITLGGAGMTTFYDEKMPQTVNKIAKQYGAKVDTIELHGNHPQVQAEIDHLDQRIKNYQTEEQELQARMDDPLLGDHLAQYEMQLEEAQQAALAREKALRAEYDFQFTEEGGARPGGIEYRTWYDMKESDPELEQLWQHYRDLDENPVLSSEQLDEKLDSLKADLKYTQTELKAAQEQLKGKTVWRIRFNDKMKAGLKSGKQKLYKRGGRVKGYAPGGPAEAELLPTSWRDWVEPNVRQAKDIGHGLMQLPYLAAGTPVDLVTAAMRPMGYNVEKPVGSSEWLIDKAREYGMLPPPGGPGEQLGSVLASTIDPYAGAAKLAGILAPFAVTKPSFYSAAERALEKLPNQGTASQMLSTLQNSGVKKAELEDRGLTEMLTQLGDQPVSKEQIVEQLKARPVMPTPSVLEPNTGVNRIQFKDAPIEPIDTARDLIGDDGLAQFQLNDSAETSFQLAQVGLQSIPPFQRIRRGEPLYPQGITSAPFSTLRILDYASSPGERLKAYEEAIKNGGLSPQKGQALIQAEQQRIQELEQMSRYLDSLDEKDIRVQRARAQIEQELDPTPEGVIDKINLKADEVGAPRFMAPGFEKQANNWEGPLGSYVSDILNESGDSRLRRAMEKFGLDRETDLDNALEIIPKSRIPFKNPSRRGGPPMAATSVRRWAPEPGLSYVLYHHEPSGLYRVVRDIEDGYGGNINGDLPSVVVAEGQKRAGAPVAWRDIQRRVREDTDELIDSGYLDMEDDDESGLWESMTVPGGKNHRVVQLGVPDYPSWEKKQGHFAHHQKDPGNTVVHALVKDRKIGRKTWFHVDELQSDVHQTGRDSGYAQDRPANLPKYGRAPSDPVPNLPHKGNWSDLAVKYLSKSAAEKGYDGIMINDADTLIQRYGESKAAGMEYHYGNRVPQALRDLAKKHGIEVKQKVLKDANGDPYGAYFLEFNDSLRKALLEGEQKLYRQGGRVRS